LSRIFISYRRGDASADAGRLHYYLSLRFGGKLIFKDIDSISPGQRFASVIEEALRSCEVFLAVIGPTWLDSRNPDGTRRLDDPQDWVRIEIAQGLVRKGVTMIPVRVRGAQRPRPEQLPDDLKPLVALEDCELSDRKWQRDVEDLVTLLEGYLGTKAQRGGSALAFMAGAAATARELVIRAARRYAAASRWVKVGVLGGFAAFVAAAVYFAPGWLEPAPSDYHLQIDPPKVFLEWRPNDEMPVRQVVRYTNDGRAALTLTSFELRIDSAARTAYRLRENACFDNRLTVGESCTVLVEFHGKWLEDYQKDTERFSGKLQFEVRQTPKYVYSTEVVVTRKP
jgi:hypothetical protein